MPFSPSITQLSSGSTIKTFTDTANGIIFNSDPVKRRMLLSTSAAIAKNAVFIFTVPTDLNIIAALPVISGAASSASIRIEALNPNNAKLMIGTFTHAVVSAYLPFWDSFVIARGTRVSVSPSEILERLTFVAEEIFIEQITLTS